MVRHDAPSGTAQPTSSLGVQRLLLPLLTAPCKEPHNVEPFHRSLNKIVNAFSVPNKHNAEMM